MSLARGLDLPPIWTLGLILASAGLASIAPAPWIDAALAEWPAGRAAALALALASLGLALWAAATMLRARTSVIPREQPAALVTGGPFRFSRNPIYLADLGFLAAAGLYLGSIWPILATPLLVAILTKRFIAGEEAALAAAFPSEFRAWSARVRRWL